MLNTNARIPIKIVSNLLLVAVLEIDCEVAFISSCAITSNSSNALPSACQHL